MPTKIQSKDGTIIFADASGNPSLPAIVFIHGLCSHTSVFDRLFADESLLNEHYLVRYDMRGHGFSDKPEEQNAYESHRFAEDFQAVSEAFSLQRPFLAGWSLGGTNGADVLAHLGDTYLSGIIYLSAIPALDGITAGQIIPFLKQHYPGLFSTDDTRLALTTRIDMAKSLSSDLASVPPATLAGWIGAGTLVSPLTANLSLDRVQDSAALQQAGVEGKLPAALIAGSGDLNRELMGEETQKWKNVSVTSIDGAGHIVFWDRQKETVKAILAFTKKIRTEG